MKWVTFWPSGDRDRSKKAISRGTDHQEGGVLMDGEARSQLLQFYSEHDQTLIEVAGIYQDSNREVGNVLAQWLSRSKQKGHQ